MTPDYDVVIAGGGPAGGQAARDLAYRNFDVCVLEKDSYVGETRQSTGGTFPGMTSEFDVDPEEVAMEETDKVVIEGPDEKLLVDQTGYVLDFGEFKRYLAEDAETEGADYRLDRQVVGLDRDVNDGLGVVANLLDGEGQETVTGDVVIDATGAHATLGQKEGMVEYDRSEDLAVGVEYEMENVDMEVPGSMMLKVDSEYAPGGYSWIFDTGGDTAKVGVCWFNKYKNMKDPDAKPEEYFEKFWEEDPRLQEAEKIEKDGEVERHAGMAFIQDIDEKVDDRLILAGDTVSSIDPVWGEGINNCMVAGRLAAETVTHADHQNDYSESTLSLYNSKWEQRLGDNRDSRLDLADKLYRLNDENVDRVIRGLNSLDREELSLINKEADSEAVVSMLRKNPMTGVHIAKDHPGMVAEVLKDRFTP
ncbi:MAG: digeranylgeranylglycerophospholipid reductase [Candidatus Nanohaloarchaea archaeon]|jgi:digeranylgeranylglycerophospholipid reductase